MRSEIRFRWGDARYMYRFRESEDGRYYVANTGNVLHISERCGWLWASKNVLTDASRTLSYRVLRGDQITGPYGYRIVFLCTSCATWNDPVKLAMTKREPVDAT